MPRAVYHRSLRFAHAALDAATRGASATAEEILGKLAAECGDDGIRYACMTWCDALIEHTYGDRASEADLVLNLSDGAGMIRGTAGPAWFDWATQVVRARAAGDGPRFAATIADLDDTRRDYPALLLSAIAHTMTSRPRGETVPAT